MPAFILMILKHRHTARYDHQKTQNHTSEAVLFTLLGMGKMGSCVAFVLDPCRNKRKKEIVSKFAMHMLVLLHTFLCNTTPPAPNQMPHGKSQLSASPQTLVMASSQAASCISLVLQHRNRNRKWCRNYMITFLIAVKLSEELPHQWTSQRSNRPS
jgi:hypothetical protein